MVWSFRRDVYSVKMWFHFAFVVTIGLLLMSTMVDSISEFVMIRRPLKTNDKKLKLTCMTEDTDGVLFWMGDQKKIRLVDDCALTHEQMNNTECYYDSFIGSNVTFLKWRFSPWPTKQWSNYTTTKYPLELELETQLQGYLHPEGWFISPRNAELYLQGTIAGPVQLQRYEKTHNASCRTWNRALNMTKVQGILSYEWHVHPYQWDLNPNTTPNTECNWVSPPHTSGVRLSGKKNTIEYHCLHTTLKKASLDFEVEPSGENFCLGLLVSICHSCEFDITLNTPKNSVTQFSKNKIVTSENPSERIEELIWQFEKITFPLKNGIERISIHIVTEGNGNNNSYWLFHSIRSCDSTLQRISTITDSEHDLPCQKISSRKNTTIHSNAKIKTNFASTRIEKLLTRMNYPSHNFGSGVSICESTDGNVSCACAPGFKGTDCREECPLGKFGSNCIKECNSTYNQNICNKTSGCCILGCKKQNFLLPFCEKKLEHPSISYSLPVEIHHQKTLSQDEKRNIRYEIQEQGNSDQWASIDDDRVLSNSSVWSELMMLSYLRPHLKYNIRTVLNETRSLPSVFDVSQLLRDTVQNIRKELEPGIVKLTWRLRIRWKNMNWFCLLLTPEREENQSWQDPVWKFYPIKENQTTYSGILLLETAGNYKISFFMSTNDTEEFLELTHEYVNLPETIRLVDTEDLHTNRTKTTIELDRPSQVNTIANPTVRVFVHGFLKCSKQFTAPSDAIIEWEVESYERMFIPKRLKIGNISNCQLLPDIAYVVKVLVSDLDKNEATLFSTKIEQLSNNILMIVLLVLFFILLAGFTYFSVHRTCNQIAKQPIYETEISRRDSSAHPEKLIAFETSVKKDVEDGVLEQQFTLLPKGLVRPCEYGRLPENKYKNRYGNLIAYDDTRVMLVKNPGDPYSDYINANYVQGYEKKNAYIATQGPLPETVADFWRMVWQEEVRVICMLVDLVEGRKVMCEVYWPEVGREVEYGNFVISNVAESIFADYICRTFVVSTRSGMERRQVDHLQYRGWTDQDIPMYSHSLLEYLKRLQSIAPGPGPIVVHCCAGVGRTGCIILCDICLHRIIVEGTVNVRAEAESIYNARANMLRNYLQYTLAHMVPIQFRRLLPTTLPCRDLSADKIQELKDKLPEHMTWLQSSAWMSEALRPLEPLRPTHPENVLKNRFQRFMPAGPYLVKLPRYPEYDTTSDYISAVSVDGVKMKKQYLASQLPMPSTLTDFWRLIVHENVELIVILHNADPDDDTCCAVIPREKTVIPYPYVKVETKEILETNEYFTSSALLLTDSTQVPKTTRNIIAFTCNNWRHDLVTSLPSQDALINLWSASEKMKRTSAPTLVLCYDGFTACGLYIAMSFVLQRISLDQECDVISAVQAVRRSRSDFVQFQWQFEYLYDAVMKHMNF